MIEVTARVWITAEDDAFADAVLTAISQLAGVVVHEQSRRELADE